MECSTATETKLICIHKVLTVNRYLILFDWYSSQIVSHQFDCSNDSRYLLEKDGQVSCDFNIRKCSLVLIETMSPQWRLLSLYYRDSLLYARLDFYRLCDIRTFHNIQRKFTQGTEGNLIFKMHSTLARFMWYEISESQEQKSCSTWWHLNNSTLRKAL